MIQALTSFGELKLLTFYIKEFHDIRKKINYQLLLNVIFIVFVYLAALAKITLSRYLFDVFANALAFMFILEIDDWMYVPIRGMFHQLSGFIHIFIL